MTNWAVLTIAYSVLATGLRVTVTTDNLVHLFMRYTTTPPQKHVLPRNERGAGLGHYLDQCFVAYHDNEQEEAGDTTTHTFLKTNWPVCQTRWFIFHGTREAIPTPSASPIFEKHRTEPGDPITYCHRPPHDPEQVFYHAACYRLSYCFRPCDSFIPSHLTLWLKQLTGIPYPTTIKVQFYTADALGKPLTPISTTNSFPLGTLDPTWHAIRNPIVCDPLTPNNNYAFDTYWSYFPRVNPVQKLGMRQGEHGSCQPPLHDDARSRLMACTTHWLLPCDCSAKPWDPYAIPGYNFKLEGYPTS